MTNGNSDMGLAQAGGGRSLAAAATLPSARLAIPKSEVVLTAQREIREYRWISELHMSLVLFTFCNLCLQF